MNPRISALPLIAALLLGASCGSDDSKTAGSSPDATTISVADTTGGGGSGSTDSPAPLCLLATADDFATLFPGATIGTPDPSSNSCTIAMTTAGGTAYFLMTPSLLSYDDRLQQDTDLGFTISQLDGIGDRAYYSPGNEMFPQADLVFEKAGTTYSLRATYTNSGLAMPAEPGLQDTLMRIAAAWAATL
ncbi:MAG: hypothetical protein ABMA25_01825 [Ilumatobacteraceae bacterium]